MRRLIYVPMIHTPNIAAQEMKKKEFGSGDIKVPEENLITARFYWAIVHEAVTRVEPQNMRIYFESFSLDSLKGIEAFDSLITPEDKRHSEFIVLYSLLRRGAILETTESKELHRAMGEKFRELGEIYGKIQQDLENASEDEVVTEEDLKNFERLAVVYEELDSLIPKRDEYIAKRITNTLKEGETGILFIGGAHDVIGKLPAEIQIELLDERLNEFQEFFLEGRRVLADAAGQIRNLENGLESKE